MEKTRLGNPDNSGEQTSLISHISSGLAHVKSQIQSSFSSSPKRRSARNTRLLGIEDLEGRVMMSATPFDSGDAVAAEVCTIEDHAHNATAEQAGPTTIADRQTPLGLASKTPHFHTDFLTATPEDPITVQAKVTFEHEYSYPSLIIAQSERTDHRNGLREAIYVQIDRNGNGNIIQFLGSDDNRQSKFTYDALPVGGAADLKMTYDGSEVSISISHEGAQVAKHTFTPPNSYSSAKFGISNIKWDSSAISATLQSFVATQGKEVEIIDCVEAVVEEEPVIENTSITEALDALLADPDFIAAIANEPIEEVETTQSYGKEVFSSDTPLGLASKTPHFQTDFLTATPEDPVTVRAQFTYEAESSYPSILIAQSERTDHRNGLREAIYVLAGRNGSGNIMQFLGSDDNRQSEFTYDALPVGATVDVEVTYDGSEVSVRIVHEGVQIAEHAFTPPISYNLAKFGSSDMRWDSSAVSAMQQSFVVNQGKEVEMKEEVQEVSDTSETRLKAFEEKKAELQKQINALMLQKADIETRMARGEALAPNDIQAQIDDLNRQKIPYSRMHVKPGYSGDNPTFVVHYASNRPQTYIELTMQGGGDFKRTIEHASGQEDGLIEINMRQLLQHNHTNGGEVEIKMYVDSSKDELLDVFNGRYSPGKNATLGETNGNWNDLETGRIVENPYEPVMTISQLSGPNVIISLQSPHDSSIISLGGGGHFAQKTLHHEGGAELASARLTFNADNPTGDYSIRVREGMNGKYVTGQGVHWDADTKELTMTSENPTIVATRDTEAAFALQAMRQQLGVQSSLDTTVISIPSLRQVQYSRFYEHSSFLIEADDAQMYIDNSVLKGHPDAGAIFHQTLGGYERAIKETLDAAAKVAVAAWNGESQQEAEDFFQREYNRVGEYRYLLEFTGEFGVSLPPADAILQEGMRLADTLADSLVDIQAKKWSVYARDTYFAGLKGGSNHNPVFIGGEFGGGGVVVTPDGTLVGSEQVAEEYIQSTIADRVAERLNTRLASMSIEERAEARGLLRLHQQGRLDEYLQNALENRENNVTSAETEDESGVDSENVTFAFLVSRPLQHIDGASHNFIVVNAKYRGDPNATVYSYGQNDNGLLGSVDHQTTNSGSATTYQADIDAWLSLAGPFDQNNPVQLQLIPASSDVVSALAQSLVENQDYSMMAGIFGANSNSAAQAVANAAAAMQIPVPETGRIPWGSSSYDKIEFTIPLSNQ